MTTSLFSAPVAMPDLSTPCAYAGIGSRSAPADVLALMTRIARRLAEMGHTLRSGAAPGADAAFEAGHREVCGAERLAVYFPWPNYEREPREGRGWFGGMAMAYPSNRAMSIAEMYHPRWRHLTHGSRRLHGRNANIAFGNRLDEPSSFGVVWTPDGALTRKETTEDTGGTGQFIRMADASGIPVWNLQRDDHRRAWERWLR
jgi:hypothetical protein